MPGDPTLEQLAQALDDSFSTLKDTQAAVGPLQTAADAADTALVNGKQAVIAQTADVDAKLQALIDYIHGTPPPAPPDGGGGGSPMSLSGGKRTK